MFCDDVLLYNSCSARPPCSPSWVRTRWALLMVFWLGWLGMLVGAVLIILQAPRCRDLPATNWWNDGPLYQIGRIQAFTDARNLKGESIHTAFWDISLASVREYQEANL